MILFHRTYNDSAQSILAEGFRDATDYYLTKHLYTGVWLSDRPLGAIDGVTEGDTLLEVNVDISPDKWEWVEEGKGYREFLIPADVVNRFTVRIVDEMEEIRRLEEGEWD